MLASARRVPLTLRWRLLTPTNSAIYKPLSFSSGFASKQGPPTFSSISSFTRPLSTSSHPKSSPAAASAELSDEPSAPEVPRLTTFSELSEKGLIHKNVINTITRTMGFDTMTEVQSMTVSEALTGVDVLAQAKTGTGKTMAFLLPIIQRILQSDPALAERRPYQRARVSDTRALIISPTRELAEQISKEAQRLVNGTALAVQLSVGGANKRSQLQQMHQQGCHILVGTPGRLKDIFSDPSAGVSAPRLNALVLDEADRLLDDGFWPEIEAIQHLLPDAKVQDRQTLMFSATVPRDVVLFARSIMKRNLHYVQTVSADDVPTTQLVDQNLVVVPGLEYALPTLLELCTREIKKTGDPSSLQSNFKAIVYFNTTAEVELANQMFERISQGSQPARGRPRGPKLDAMGLDTLPIIHIHSKLTQMQRTRNATAFRNSDSGILLSSDVTARGMDFPNVTHVIQIGVSKDGRDTYVHRIGRTARAGKAGQGWLILSSAMVPRTRKVIGDMPIKRDKTLETPNLELNEDLSEGIDLSNPQLHFFKTIQNAARFCDQRTMRDAYKSLLGSLGGYFRDKQQLVDELNRIAMVTWGMDSPPSMNPESARIMGYGSTNLGSNNWEDSAPSDRRGFSPSKRRDFAPSNRRDFPPSNRGGFAFSNRRDSRSDPPNRHQNRSDSAFNDFGDTRSRPGVRGRY